MPLGNEAQKVSQKGQRGGLGVRQRQEARIDSSAAYQLHHMWTVGEKKQRKQWPWLIGPSGDPFYLLVYFCIPENGAQSLTCNALPSRQWGEQGQIAGGDAPLQRGFFSEVPSPEHSFTPSLTYQPGL